ncbi:DnaJ domain-containing protein [Leptolyngbyaceae cyanobacterium UHCC 1019]
MLIILLLLSLMNSADCYRLLGLSGEASFEDIKVAYRSLARKYHPDVSSGDQRAKDKFIEATIAYKWLLNSVPREINQHQAVTNQHNYQASVSKARPGKQTKPAVQVQVNPSLSPLEQQLKASSYQQLQQLLRTQKFPRAIALVESLAQRMSRDPEVIQWQAIVYQQWGRFLIRDHQIDKARIYLRKALQTDPHNRSLWAEVEKDFRCISK